MTMPNQVSWHVLGDQITQTSTLAPGGAGFTDVYEVPYVIDSGPAQGHRGMVRIPHDRLTAAAVTAAIDAQVAAVHAVAGAGG